MASQAKLDDRQYNDDPISDEFPLEPLTPDEIEALIRRNPHLTLADFDVPKTQTALDALIRQYVNFEISSSSLTRHGIGEYASIMDHVARLGLRMPQRAAEDEPDPVIRAEQLAGRAIVTEIMMAHKKRHPDA